MSVSQCNLNFTNVTNSDITRPISTYSGRATEKPGIEQESHAIVYADGTEPIKLAGEVRMNKEPIAVKMAAFQKLDPLSRVNFNKVHTVEHYVKVKNVGKVTDASMPKLKWYWEMHRA